MRTVEGWVEKKLIELAEYINGYAFNQDDWEADGVPIIRIEQLKRPDSSTDYYSGKISEKHAIENGDLIFSWSASLFLKIWDHGKAVLNQHLFKVVEREDVDRVFLKNFIDFYLPELTKASHGSTMQHITRKELEKFGALFPSSKSEQTKIAEILSIMDSAIDQTAELITKQQRIKIGLMQDLLTCGIDENGNIRLEETHQFKNSSIGRIPKEWDVDELGNVAEFVTSGSRGWAQYYSEEGATFLRIGNLTRDHINLRLNNVVYVDPPKSSEGRRTAVVAGDILISITADLGIVGVIPEGFGEAYVNQHIALVRLLPTGAFTARFIGWFLSGQGGQNQFEKLNESGAKAGLNLPTVRKLLIPQVDPEEQANIVRILDSNTRRIDDLYSKLHKLHSLKTALMQDLITGEKRVVALLNPTEVLSD